MIRKNTAFLAAAALLCGAVHAAVLNEWTFEADAAGLSLSGSANSGVDGASFSEDAEGLTATDGAGFLVCKGTVPGVGDFWTDGTILQAAVTNQSTGVRFLRYDLDYDLSAESNNSGTLLGLSFADGTSTNLAGVFLKYDAGSGASAPAHVSETVFEEDLDFTGSLAVIAEVNLSEQTMRVWYDFSGGGRFNASNAPNATVENLNLSAIEELQFQATGDFIASSGHAAVIDNIRTAETWAEITAVLDDQHSDPELAVGISGAAAVVIGQTNLISVAVTNNGGYAGSVTSVLTHDGGSALSIVSSDNPATALYTGESVVHTYSLVAAENGSYQLTAEADASGLSSASAVLQFAVGSQISFLPPAVFTNEVGGLIPGAAEPGESFDLIISSINDGGLPVADITNSLAALNPKYFEITPAQDVYPFMAVGETNTSVYRVVCSEDTPAGAHTFSVLNSSPAGAWSSTFELDVIRRALLAVSTNAVTVYTAPGEAASASVTLFNNGNVPTEFSVTNDDRIPTLYSVSTQSVSRSEFGPADFNEDTVFDSWNAASSEAKEIGFEFSLFGTAYQTFSAGQDGSLTLESTNGTTAVLMPFQSNSLIDQSAIRYNRLTGGRLVVGWNYAWGQDLGLEFQAILHSDGTIQYLYEYGTWGGGMIGVSSGLNQIEIDHAPGQTGQDTLELTPVPWVVYHPAAGSVDEAGGSETLTFTADASGVPAPSTNVFTAVITGDDGAVDVEVTVIVEEENAALTVPGTFAFSGPLGYISPSAALTVNNSGNVGLTYTIVDSGLAEAGYTWEPADYQWQYIPVAADYILDEAQLDSAPVEIGFPFTFYGNSYTSLVVHTDGSLTLGEGGSITPFSAGLTLDDDAQVRMSVNAALTRFTVTWESMNQFGSADDQTFQAVLYRDDGTVRFNYQKLTGNWTNGVIALTRNSSGTEATLINDDTSTATTNVTYEIEYVTNWIGNAYFVTEEVVGTNTEVVVTFSENASLQSIAFTPGQEQIITFSPMTGTVPVDASSEISLVGDARGFSGSDDVVSSTTLAFIHEGGTNEVDVTFTATNQTASAGAPWAVQTAMWGSDDPSVSFEQNADGTRTLSWPAPADSLSRTYTVWYTTSLAEEWKFLKAVENSTSCIDAVHEDEPTIFYRVTVE